MSTNLSERTFRIAAALRRALGRATQSRFVRSVAVVAGGTAFAQTIGVLFSPVVTRLYGPDAYGVLGVFLAGIAILSTVATMGYSLALSMPSDDKDAVELFHLSVQWAVVLAVAILPVLILFRDDIAELLGFRGASSYVWLLAPAALLTGVYEAFAQWLVRKRRFGKLATTEAGAAATVGLSKVSIGMLAPTPATLILATVGGKALQMIAAGIYGRDALRSAQGHAWVADRRLRRNRIARNFRDFPLFRAPQNLLNAVSRNFPVFLFSSMFGASVAGFYAIGQRVLQLPIALVSRSVGKVLLPRLAEVAQEGKPIRATVLKSTLGLALVGVVPFGLVIAFGPSLFGFVFGAEWETAGNIARWLSLWLYLGFVNVPSVQSLAFTNSQHFLLVWEILTTISKVLAIVLGARLTHDIMRTVQLYSLIGSAAYMVLILEALRRAGVPERIRPV